MRNRLKMWTRDILTGCLFMLVFGLILSVGAFAADPVAQTAAGGWLADNWFAVAAILFGALSEVIGLSPLKSNSIVQLILGLLGKAFVRKAAVVLFLASFAFAGCGGAGILKTAQVTKDTAETALYEARVMERQGVITADQFAEVTKAYETVRAAQGVLIDARETYLKSPTQDNQSAVTAAIVALAADSAQLIDIARKYKVGEGILWK
jgi:hypothetical protein